MKALDKLKTLCCKAPYKRLGRADYVCESCWDDVSVEFLFRIEAEMEAEQKRMPKRHPETYYAQISGIEKVTDSPHKYSPKFNIYDKNMRKLRGQSFRPFTHEVPAGGCVVVLMYNQPKPEMKFFDEPKDDI